MNDYLNYIRASLNWREESVRYSPTPGIWARQNLYFIQEAGRFQALKGYLTERRDLDSILLVYTRGGHGRLFRHGNRFDIQANQLFLIDCMTEHLYETIDETGWDFDWVHFNGPGVRSLLEIFDAQDSSPIRIVHPDSTIPELFNRLYELLERKGICQEFQVSSLLIALLTESIILAMDDYPPKGSRHVSVTRAIEILEGNLEKKITLDQLSLQCSTDKYYLIKLFRQHTGLTPMAYLQQARISKAKELLLNTSQSVERIGEAVGFSPASYFITVFRRWEQMTPLAYRKYWQHLSE